jgi:hypothetical protein
MVTIDEQNVQSCPANRTLYFANYRSAGRVASYEVDM